jgi:hypothetical protein
MTTKGLEIDLGLVPVKTEDFTWNLRASYATNKSVINFCGLTEVNLSLTQQQEQIFLLK